MRTRPMSSTTAKVLIAEIAQGNPEDEFYNAKVMVLSELIKHHMKEEEKAREGLVARARKGEVDARAKAESITDFVARSSGCRGPCLAQRIMRACLQRAHAVRQVCVDACA